MNTYMLSPLQERAARMIAEGWSQAATAREINKTKQTLNRWCNQNEAFMQRVDDIRAEQDKRAEDIFIESIPDAIDTIVKIAKEGGQTVQFNAARYILDNYLSLKKKITTTNGTEVEYTDEEDEEDIFTGMSDEEIEELANR